MIKGTTQLLGVIGYPVEHSFSPVMHNAAIAHLNDQLNSQPSDQQRQPVDFVYLPFPIHPDLLAVAIAGFTAIGLRGFNITIPHKQSIIPLLDEVSDVARAIGAVNTVWRSEDAQGIYQWRGTNTDAVGFLAPLQALERDWSEAPAVVLGNGGAARAVVAACVQLGCPEVVVVGRSPDKLEAFARSWNEAPNIAKKLSVLPWDRLAAVLPKARLVVNATPVGMHPQVNLSPLGDEEVGLLGAGSLAYDLIYTPRPTHFLQQASAAGLTAIDGLEMLVQQGAAALEIWLGQPAPAGVMRQALLDHLGQKQ
ncbi:MAG: shikimate dehydrogenase [Cyanobacteria bacterium J06598_3]